MCSPANLILDMWQRMILKFWYSFLSYILCAELKACLIMPIYKMLIIEPRASCMLCKHSTTWPTPSVQLFICSSKHPAVPNYLRQEVFTYSHFHSTHLFLSRSFPHSGWLTQMWMHNSIKLWRLSIYVSATGSKRIFLLSGGKWQVCSPNSCL